MVDKFQYLLSYQAKRNDIMFVSNLCRAIVGVCKMLKIGDQSNEVTKRARECFADALSLHQSHTTLRVAARKFKEL